MRFHPLCSGYSQKCDNSTKRYYIIIVISAGAVWGDRNGSLHYISGFCISYQK